MVTADTPGGSRMSNPPRPAADNSRSVEIAMKTARAMNHVRCLPTVTWTFEATLLRGKPCSCPAAALDKAKNPRPEVVSQLAALALSPTAPVWASLLRAEALEDGSGTSMEAHSAPSSRPFTALELSRFQMVKTLTAL